VLLYHLQHFCQVFLLPWGSSTKRSIYPPSFDDPNNTWRKKLWTALCNFLKIFYVWRYTETWYWIFIVVLPCILISSKLLCQQMHCLLKYKMLQLTFKISLCMAPTCFGPFGPSSASIRRNLAKVTVFEELLVKIHR
jgi:hypothetical protein